MGGRLHLEEERRLWVASKAVAGAQGAADDHGQVLLTLQRPQSRRVRTRDVDDQVVGYLQFQESVSEAMQDWVPEQSYA